MNIFFYIKKEFNPMNGVPCQVCVCKMQNMIVPPKKEVGGNNHT